MPEFHAAEWEAWLSAAAKQRRTLVMGVLNVTPDSFSDGGRFTDVAAAVERAREMVSQGADLIDIGAESTRPGAAPVDAQEQISRAVPAIRAISAALPGMVLSIDTTRAAVAERALDAGAAVINDISAGRDDLEMLPLAARRGAAIVLMHRQGTPATMQRSPAYSDVMGEVIDFLRGRCDAAAEAGIAPRRVLVDPGIGFGKTAAHNLELLRRLPELGALGRPIVLGTSRKGFIGQITGEAEPARRLLGTAATIAWGVANGAGVVRVHDVGAMVQVTRMIEAIRSAPVSRKADTQDFS